MVVLFLVWILMSEITLIDIFEVEFLCFVFYLPILVSTLLLERSYTIEPTSQILTGVVQRHA